MKKLTIIIPSYNEEKNVRPFYQETVKHLTDPDYTYELLYVNDGSRDATLSEIKAVAAEDPRVKYISFSRNFGKEAAMHAGLEHAIDSDAVIVIDCDLQQPPSLIPEMIKYHKEGYKIVYTKGRTRKNEPKLRALFANLYYRFYNSYADRPLDNGAKDFQLLDRVVIDAFLKIKDKNRFMKGIFSWVGYSRKCLEYDFIPRVHGKSSWSFKSLFRYGFNGMNQFSNVMMVLPAIGFLFGVLMLAANAVLFAFDIFTLDGFLIAVEINIVFLFLTLFTYGILYLLYQIRRQVLDRPHYLIEEISEDIDVE
ncbi:MAG: glycosyltransferase family 2 protein [Bacillota bacterium]|nr:glycosyltransferase family 2 protein [Bacillota bacterium]